MPGVWLPWASLGLSFPPLYNGRNRSHEALKAPLGKESDPHQTWEVWSPTHSETCLGCDFSHPPFPQHTHPHSGGSVGGGSMATEHGNRAARLHGAQWADLSWSPGCPLSTKVTSLDEWQATTGPSFQETDDPEPSKVMFRFPDLSPLRSLTLRTAVGSLTRS